MRKIFYGWWIVLFCSIISFYVAGIIYFGFTAFFEPIGKEFGWSHTQISLAASLRGLEMGIFAPFIGFLVDRLGVRKLLFWGMITTGMGLILLSRTQSLLMFYASFMFVAFGAGGCAALVTTAAVANWFHKKVGIALGITASGVGAGGLMVPIIVRLIEMTGWRTTLVILGMGMWVLGIPLSLAIRNRPEQYGCVPDGSLSGGPVHEKRPQEKGVEVSFREVLKKKTFLYLNIVEIIRMSIVAAVIVHVMPYLGSLGFSRAAAGLAAGSIPLFSIIGRFGFGWLSDFFDKKNIIAFAFCAMSLGMLAFCYVKTGWILLLFLVLFPTGYGGGMVLRGAIIREYFGRDSFGKTIGIIMGSSAVGGIIGPTLAGWVFDSTGSYSALWMTSFGLGILTIFLIRRLR